MKPKNSRLSPELLRHAARTFKSGGATSVAAKAVAMLNRRLTSRDLLNLPGYPRWEDIAAVQLGERDTATPLPSAQDDVGFGTAQDDVGRSGECHTASVINLHANDKKLNITWIMPPVVPGAGGHRTISRFARALSEAGHNVSFAIYNTAISQSDDDAAKILRDDFGLTDISVIPLPDAAKADVAIATTWETAYPLYTLPAGPEKIYFVQDFEPSFTGIGSRYKLAEATYQFGFYGITAGRWLTQKVGEYGMEADYFDFGADLDVYVPTSGVMPPKKKQILFYARPASERRGFELGVMALTLFHQMHPEYEIVTFGQPLPEYKLPFPAKNLGTISPQELAKLYHESVTCLVISLTNISLLPLELLAGGCVPVINTGPNNELELANAYGIEYAEALPLDLANALSRAVNRPDVAEHAAEISRRVQTATWDASYAKVEQLIADRVANRGN